MTCGYISLLDSMFDSITSGDTVPKYHRIGYCTCQSTVSKSQVMPGTYIYRFCISVLYNMQYINFSLIIVGHKTCVKGAITRSKPCVRNLRGNWFTHLLLGEWTDCINNFLYELELHGLGSKCP